MSDVDHDRFIGGSDVAKIMGDHAFDGPKSVYQRLREGYDYEAEDLSGNRDIMRGNYCEPLALREIEKQFPSLNSEEVKETFDVGGGRDGQIRLQHPKKPFIAGSVDGMSIDPFADRATVHEVKAPRSSGIKRIEKRGIPPRYFWQVQMYSGLASEKFGGEIQPIVWVWNCDKWDVERINVEFREDLYEKALKRCERFWAFASEDIPFDDTDLAENSETPETYKSEKMSRLLAEYYDIYGMFKEFKKLKSKLKSKILSQINGEERLEGVDHYATIKEYSNSTHLTVREK